MEKIEFDDVFKKLIYSFTIKELPSWMKEDWKDGKSGGNFQREFVKKPQSFSLQPAKKPSWTLTLIIKSVDEINTDLLSVFIKKSNVRLSFQKPFDRDRKVRTYLYDKYKEAFYLESSYIEDIDGTGVKIRDLDIEDMHQNDKHKRARAMLIEIRETTKAAYNETIKIAEEVRQGLPASMSDWEKETSLSSLSGFVRAKLKYLEERIEKVEGVLSER